MPATKSSGYPRLKAEPRRGRKGSRDQAERLRGRVGEWTFYHSILELELRTRTYSHSRTRTSISCKVTFVAGRFGDSEVWRGADFVAQQTMLRCATKGWLVAQGG